MSFANYFNSRAPRQLRRLFTSIDLLPIRFAVRAYNRQKLRGDARAALDVALLAFPQGLAYALIAGLPIAYGLFGSAFASIVGSFFAGSRFVVVGPTNATAVLTLSAFLAIGATEGEMAFLVPLLLLMVGAMQIAAAYLNIGSLIAYISRAVVVGYISAAAVLIMVNQIRNLLGIQVPDAPTLLMVLGGIVRALPETHWPTVAVSLATAATFLSLRRWTPKLPTAAITLLASMLFGLVARLLEHPVRMLPSVSASSFQVDLPQIDFAEINHLASAALAIAFLGILESASIGKSLAARAGERLHTNQEIFALGMANVGCSCLGGMPASGSLTRSALASASGAATPLASLYCGLLSLVLVFGLGMFLGHLPRAALAVVVVFVALSLINPRQIRFVVRATRADATVFAVTAGSALVFPLDTAIFIGAATSIVLFLEKAGEPELVEYTFTEDGQLAERRASEKRQLPEISIVHVEGSLFFGAAELLQEQIRRVCDDPNLRILVLRLKHAHHLDASAVLALEELVQFMRENGRGLIVSGARKEVFRICKRTGLLDLIGRDNFFVEWPQNPTLSTRNALKRAQQILGRKDATVRIFGEMRTKTPDTPS
jgi:SulP family sulfate permease